MATESLGKEVVVIIPMENVVLAGLNKTTLVEGLLVYLLDVFLRPCLLPPPPAAAAWLRGPDRQMELATRICLRVVNVGT